MGERLLQHVEIWENGRYTRIEPNEFQRRFCKAERSSKHLFCSLCNQSVHFSTNGRTPYFKHNKDTDYCPEKSAPNDTLLDDFFNVQEYEFPIRLTFFDEYSAYFELGLYQLPRDIIERNADKTFVLRKLPGNEKLGEWKFERLQNKEMRYFPIGGIFAGNVSGRKTPSSGYRLLFEDNQIKDYWRSYVSGLDFSQPIWFDARSKKKLPRDADLYVGREYYLFSKQNVLEKLSNDGYGISAKISLKHTYRTDTKTIFLFDVIANVIDGRTANFFRESFRRRLTQTPVKLVPLWPPSVRDQYVVKIDRKSKTAYFYFRGSGYVTAKTYPHSVSKTIENERGGLLRIGSDSIQKAELVSMGRTSVLQYALLWRESSKFLAPEPIVEIVDADDENVRFETHKCSRLPKKQRLLLKYPFDGYCEIFQNERLVDKRELSSDGKTEIVVQWGTTVKVYQGKDFVREIGFVRQTSSKFKTDDDLPSDRRLLEMLKRQRGQLAPIPPGFASIATRMSGYPQTKAWLRAALFQGEAPYAVLEILKNMFVH